MPSYGGVGHRPRAVERYLLSGERCVVAVRRHWICIAEPWVTVLASLLLVAWLTFDVASPRTTWPLDILWWLWFALVARALWTTFDHQRTWFVATDRRLLMVYGFIIRRVAMMPLAKVTDMSYHRSPLGWVLGYGTFVLESAGQDQALHEIDHVPHPDPAYRAIVSEIFHKDVDDAVPSVGDSGEYVRDDDPAAAAAGPWDDDPTGSYALPAEEARRWGERLRGAGGRAGRGGRGAADWLRGRADRYPSAQPDPSVGAQHGVSDRTHTVSDRATARAGEQVASDGGEWLYRSGSSSDADDRRDPPRDATGYWG